MAQLRTNPRFGFRRNPCVPIGRRPRNALRTILVKTGRVRKPLAARPRYERCEDASEPR